MLAFRNNLGELGHNNNAKGKISNAQALHTLKRLCDEVEHVPTRMVKDLYTAGIKGTAKYGSALDGMNEEIAGWKCFSNNTCGDTDMNRNKVISFINKISTQDDYIKSFLFKEEEVYSLWVIIKNAAHENRMNYIRRTREELNTESNLVDLMIFSEDEVDEVIDELNDLSVTAEEF